MTSSALLPQWLSTVLVLAPTLIGLADGCYRRAAQKVTTAAPTLLPGVSTTIPSHKMNCSEMEASAKGCLNGGTCFAIQIGDIRESACRCPDGYVGGECQFIEIPTFEVRQNQLRTAHMAAGFSVFVLIVFALLLALYVWHRYKRKQQLLGDAEFEATAEELYRRPFSARSSIVESMSRPNSVRRGIPPDSVSAHPASAAALNNTSSGGGGGGSSVNGLSAADDKHYEEIHLTVMDETSDHNKQMAPSDTS